MESLNWILVFRSESEHSDNDNFSDHDDGFDDVQEETDDNRDCFEPQVDILENSENENSQAQVKTEPSTNDENSENKQIENTEALTNDSQDSDHNGDILAAFADDDDDDFRAEDSDSAHSEYLPKRAKPKTKGKRGRPKKIKVLL